MMRLASMPEFLCLFYRLLGNGKRSHNQDRPVRFHDDVLRPYKLHGGFSHAAIREFSGAAGSYGPIHEALLEVEKEVGKEQKREAAASLKLGFCQGIGQNSRTAWG